MAPVKSLKRGYKLVEMPISYRHCRPRSYGNELTGWSGFVTLWTLMRYKIVR